MKKLKDIVHDLEYAKKLKELGVGQDSLFYHNSNQLVTDYLYTKDSIGGDFYDKIKFKKQYTSVFTSDELLELLPRFIYDKNNNEYELMINKFEKKYVISFYYDNEYRNFNKKIFLDKKLSNTVSKILIYLIENKSLELRNE